MTDFLPFATGAGANVEAQATWLTDPVVTAGFSSGIAPSAGFNKAFRQGTFGVAAIANYVEQIIGANTVLDDGVINNFLTHFWQALLRGQAFVDSGSANAIVIAAPVGITFPAPAVGLYITVKIAAANTGATTLNWMGNGAIAVRFPDLTALQGAELRAGSYATLIYDGTYWQLLTVPTGPKLYKFDVGTPPAASISMNPADKVLITFTAQASVPMHIASVPGIYRLTMAVIQSSAANNDIGLAPNDTTYAGAFSRYSISMVDQTLTAFGTATAAEGFTTITGTVPGFVSALPHATYGSALNLFFIDMFQGPSASDTINDIGPFIMDWTISTYTSTKMIKTTSGEAGGPATSYSLWSDTTTAWTSLGTLSMQVGTPTPTITGSLQVERVF